MSEEVWALVEQPNSSEEIGDVLRHVWIGHKPSQGMLVAALSYQVRPVGYLDTLGGNPPKLTVNQAARQLLEGNTVCDALQFDRYKLIRITHGVHISIRDM